MAFLLLFYFLGILPRGGKEADESQRRMMEAAIIGAGGNGTIFVMQGAGN